MTCLVSFNIAGTSDDKKLPIACIQYHPEAGPGPHDSKVFFDNFVNVIKEYKEKNN